MIFHRFTARFILILSFLAILASCEKFEGDQTVPAYLTIDSLYLQTDYATQGSASHKITDAWVYVGEEFIGAFEMPARFPVLKSGKHPVKIYPGIKKNGIAATRTSYLFYAPVEKNITFAPDSTSVIGTQKTTYFNTTLFTWKEDFEDVALSLDTTPRSTAWIRLTQDEDSTFEGMHSAKVVLDSVHDFFEAQTHDEYVIPAAPVYLEMDFNLSQSMIVGVIVYSTSTLAQVPILTLSPTNGTWKKIYIDLSNSLNGYTGMITYRVYLGTFKEPDKLNSVLMFDNMKIVTRKS